MRALGAAAALSLVGALAVGCGGAPEPGAATVVETPRAAGTPAEKGGARAKAPRDVLKDDDDEREVEAIRGQVQAMLARVATTRALPILHEVPIRILDRPAMLAHIRTQAEKDLPMDVLAAQGEFLTALGLIPTDYDFVAGMFQLIQGQIAGFYVPDEGTMYLADDLGRAEAEETLAHELVHALQDQSFAIGKMIKYTPGDSDRITAAHALIEGDATSAMLDVSLGSAFAVDEVMLRRILAVSTAVSAAGAVTPRYLQASLTAPYADGFAFVQELRRRGGWTAVDGAYRALPQTTEQLLHVDKLDAHEPAVEVEVPSITPLGEGFRAVVDDVMGEQGLRIVLEDWAHRKTAKEAAAGWGGDRFVVARREALGAPDRREYATAWHVKLDTPEDAREVVDVLRERHGAACVQRPALGPLVWKARGREVVIAGGPYERRGKELRATGTCAATTKWAEAILKVSTAAPGRAALGDKGSAPARPAQKK